MSIAGSPGVELKVSVGGLPALGLFVTMSSVIDCPGATVGRITQANIAFVFGPIRLRRSSTPSQKTRKSLPLDSACPAVTRAACRTGPIWYGWLISGSVPLFVIVSPVPRRCFQPNVLVDELRCVPAQSITISFGVMSRYVVLALAKLPFALTVALMNVVWSEAIQPGVTSTKSTASVFTSG